MLCENQRLAPGDRACIIGAGCSGLAAGKALKAHEVPYDHFEMTGKVGGLWRASAERSPVYRSLRLITSKARTPFSDYPMPASVPTYGHHSDLLEYFEDYAEAFDLKQNITFDTKVTRVEPLEEGGWVVTTDGDRSRHYGAVLVCSGHHWNPRWPSFPGQFSGREMHARDYWAPEALAGRRVLVVGIGNSGSGIAADLSRTAEKVTVSTRSGVWVLPKYLLGLPTDQWTGRYQTYLPVGMRSLVLRLLRFLTVGRQESYGVPLPAHGPLAEHPTLSQDLLSLVEEGSVKIKPNVQRLNGKDVQFGDGTSEPFDEIIYATGYQIRFPFLPDAVLEVENNQVYLYKQVAHPNLPGLYFIGLAQPAGPIAPLAERQSEWVARLLSGQAELPESETMHRRIREAEAKRQAQYHESPRHTIEVDFWDYAVDIEREMER